MLPVARCAGLSAAAHAEEGSERGREGNAFGDDHTRSSASAAIAGRAKKTHQRLDSMRCSFCWPGALGDVHGGAQCARAKPRKKIASDFFSQCDIIDIDNAMRNKELCTPRCAVLTLARLQAHVGAASRRRQRVYARVASPQAKGACGLGFCRSTSRHNPLAGHHTYARTPAPSSPGQPLGNFSAH